MTLPGIQVAHIKCLDHESTSADIISKLALIPLMVGYSPITWRTGIDSMIPKKTADLRPEKLRLILLMDARFNHNNKLIGKKMMEYGEKHNLLAPEQFGSRKCKSAIEHATNKRLVMDSVRQLGKKAIYVANDAKSCYDRILLMVAYLTMRNFGIPCLAAQSTISTLLEMKHHVRTRYGDSTNYYGGEKWQTKPHGCGQGNGYGPALWACISSPLLHLLRKQGYGTKFTSPISRVLIHIAAFAFVDDVDMIQTEDERSQAEVADQNDSEKMDKLLDETQQALHYWASTLKVTGGALEPAKTFYVPIIPTWQGGKKTVKKHTKNTTLALEGPDGTGVTLQQQDPNDSFFTLGIWQSPSGDESRQVEHIIKKIQEWGCHTTFNKMTWIQAKLAVRSTIGRALVYPLTATAFNTKQCSQIQRALLHEVLGKMGFVRTIPGLIATAPVCLGGLGILSFEIQQLLSHIYLLLIHGPDEDTITHQLLRTTLEAYALEAGLPGDPLMLQGKDYVTQDTWILQTLHLLRKYDISLYSGFGGLQSWCQNDRFLMDRLALLYSGSSLAILNKVRLYLKVVTLSDIITANGQSYDLDILHGRRGRTNPNPSSNRYIWPSIPEPTRAERDLWTHSILLAFEITFTLNRAKPPITPVWNREAIHFSRWLYSPSKQGIYEHLASDRWKVWILRKRERSYCTRRSTNTYQMTDVYVPTLPEDTHIISISQQGAYIIYQDNSGTAEELDSITIPENNSRCDIDALQGYYLYNISLDNGIIISDGSYDKDSMTYAFMAQPTKFECDMESVDYDEILCDSGFAFGDAHDSNSYRAELTGLLESIRFTNTLCKEAKLAKGTCTIYCDSKGALNATFGHKRPTPRWSSYDLVRQLREELKSSIITWKYKHVKGHQDNKTSFRNLNVIAQGNVVVDHLASTQHLKEKPPRPSQPWMLEIGGNVIGGNVEYQII